MNPRRGLNTQIKPKHQTNTDFKVQKACFILNEQFYLKEVQHLTIRFNTTLEELQQIEVQGNT